MRERFIPRLLEAAHTDPERLLDESGTNLDPAAIWHAVMRNEKPGGHGERSVAVGALDLAVWDATAKIAQVPLWHLLSDPLETKTELYRSVLKPLAESE